LNRFRVASILRGCDLINPKRERGTATGSSLTLRVVRLPRLFGVLKKITASPCAVASKPIVLNCGRHMECACYHKTRFGEPCYTVAFRRMRPILYHHRQSMKAVCYVLHACYVRFTTSVRECSKETTNMAMGRNSCRLFDHGSNLLLRRICNARFRGLRCNQIVRALPNCP